VAVEKGALEKLVSTLQPFAGAFMGRRILVTGHTGFKGAWLCEWLLALGADVTGYALASPTSPALFDQLGLASRIRHFEGDVRNPVSLRATIADCQPDFIFHLAAQPLVRASYEDPVATFEVNVLGTVQVLDALRNYSKPCGVVCVTTDKCYENREWFHGYREEDQLGGHDPYSASKAAAEIAIASYRRSFFGNHPVKVASARAGNVIGGGDWATDRIIPDCIRALSAGRPVAIRNRFATRPWQHVLEPLSGYLWLGALLTREESAPQIPPVPGHPAAFASAFNFGPSHDANRTVEELVAELLKHWPGRWEDHSPAKAPHEAGRLQLAIEKAQALLCWSPVWRFPEAVAATARWYRAAAEDPSLENVCEITSGQIHDYAESARASSIPWSLSIDR
jgi:CDP-glucose 4,6-dehydratase